MKKMTYLSFLYIFIFVLAACGTSSKINENQETYVKKVPTSTGNMSTKPYVKGVKNVDVVNSHGSIDGLERMEKFYEDVQNDISSHLRIVYYTIEGDPMVKDLVYNGESIEVKYDTTRDKYGSGEITVTSCTNIIKEVNPTNTSFIAINCTDHYFGMDEILQINYNISQQDRFDFELKYGEKLENEINTHTNMMKKVMSKEEIKVTNDYVIPTPVMQEVYKKLVYANYLAEKNFSNSCNNEDTRNYYLKVYINSAHLEFRWNACDKSNDAQKFTNIAEFIIEQSDVNQDRNSDIIVQGYVLVKNSDTLLIGEEMNIMDYELIKDELHQLDAFIFDYIELEGLNTKEFQVGDKIKATLEGIVEGSNPGSAKVKEMIKIE
nr:DUF4362 domain-containing protein [Paenibacillus bovis]